MTSNASLLGTALLEQAAAFDHARMLEVFNAYLATWRDRDPSARAELFAPDAVVEDPVGAPPLCGMEAVKAFWQLGDGSGSRFEPRLELFVPGGSECLVRFVMRMIKEGEPTVELTVHETLRFDSHYRIAALRAFWSQDSFRVVSAERAGLSSLDESK